MEKGNSSKVTYEIQDYRILDDSSETRLGLLLYRKSATQIDILFRET